MVKNIWTWAHSQKRTNGTLLDAASKGGKGSFSSPFFKRELLVFEDVRNMMKCGRRTHVEPLEVADFI